MDVMIAFTVLLVIIASIVLWSKIWNPSGSLVTERLVKDKENDLDDLGLLKDAVPDESLAGKILDSFVAGTFQDSVRYYLPEKSIDRLITRIAIENELMKVDYDSESRSQLAVWIVDNARKIFAIAIQCDLEPQHLLLSMRLFRKYGFTDTRNLPIQPPENGTLSLEVFHPQIWTRLKLSNFYEKQWKFLAPVFFQDKYDYDLVADYIFPFTLIEAIPRDGAFSSVYRVSIHEDHRDHPGLQDVRTYLSRRNGSATNYWC